MPDLNKYPEPVDPSDSSGSQSPVPPQFGSPFDYDATADASLTETSAPTEKTPSTETTGTGPGWDTYAGVGNGPGWGSHPIYPPPPGNDSSGGLPPDGAPGYPQHSAYPPPGAQTSQFGAAPDGPVYGAPADPTNPYIQPSYGDAPHTQQPYGPPSGYAPYGAPPPAYGPPPGYPGYGGFGYADPSAPYGRDPLTGEPLSEKSKLTSGLLGIFLGAFGAGRFYLNQPGVAIAQIAATWLTCGIGGIWPLIDGIMMLSGNVRDRNGRPLRS
ncbi:hypothetical protein ABH922_002315 [Rhodococcus sp. 27YEA15]|uniref:TM2 domain-containing protein n=1 Tax=Rhodococcus sp. 27YEA15 TaxID=3156259 RepID=UPI003C7BCA6D